MVRTWLGLKGEVAKPIKEHPKRAVLGLACPRSEVSGARLWGAAREVFGTPQRFFRRFYVANYCPLCFMEDSGRNRTPDKLPAKERGPVFAACDEHLRRLVQVLQPRAVVGVGAFAASRARVALEGLGLQICQVLHPSPASPAANQDWSGKVKAQLEKEGLCPGCRPKS
jgi:single-strand selective monofunctional uracil DNA glycosylase